MNQTAAMRFVRAIDLFIEDQQAEGRINSPNTEREYRGTLRNHGEDVDNRDPAYTNRDDVKRTLARWPHPNTRSLNRHPRLVLPLDGRGGQTALQPGRADQAPTATEAGPLPAHRG